MISFADLINYAIPETPFVFAWHMNSMTRLLKHLVFNALFITALMGCNSLLAAEQPNILFIFIDDLGAHDLGCYGSTYHETPRIDQLAKEGLRFTNAYAACHVCSPTRAAVMTGKYPARLHITDWLTGHNKPYAKMSIPDWNIEGLPTEEHTIGEHFQAAGYKTAWLGKWHLSGKVRGKLDSPQPHGFDAGQQDWNLNSKKDGKDPKGVYTLTKEAIDFMEKHREEPFFVALSHYSVHTPDRWNEKLRKKYVNRKKQIESPQKNPKFAAMLEDLDTSVGQLLDWLDESGLADSTVVVFASDNGGLMGQTNNAPLRAGKGTLYEGGTRIPFIVRWPGVSPVGKTTDARICSIDYLPTFARVAGVDAPEEIDGIDFSSTFRGESAPERSALYWHYPHYHKGKPGGSILKGDYKLIERFEDGSLELYDLANDPYEKKNLAEEHADIAEELLNDLQAWRQEVGAQMMTPNPNYQMNKK